MIKTYNLTPEIYYNRSRDFQLLGRIYDTVFNYIKHNEALIQNITSDALDNKLVDLAATSLGFKEAHDYNVEQLKALCSMFALAVRNKGNIRGINMVLNMLMNVENIKEECYADMDYEDPFKLNIFIPNELTNTTLLKDVLTYILPAGVTCDIISQQAVKTVNETDIMFYNDSVDVKNIQPSAVNTSTIIAPGYNDAAYNKSVNNTIMRIRSGDTAQMAAELELLAEQKQKKSTSGLNSNESDGTEGD